MRVSTLSFVVFCFSYVKMQYRPPPCGFKYARKGEPCSLLAIKYIVYIPIKNPVQKYKIFQYTNTLLKFFVYGRGGGSRGHAARHSHHSRNSPIMIRIIHVIRRPVCGGLTPPACILSALPSFLPLTGRLKEEVDIKMGNRIGSPFSRKSQVLLFHPIYRLPSTIGFPLQTEWFKLYFCGGKSFVNYGQDTYTAQ